MWLDRIRQKKCSLLPYTTTTNESTTTCLTRAVQTPACSRTRPPNHFPREVSASVAHLTHRHNNIPSDLLHISGLGLGANFNPPFAADDASRRGVNNTPHSTNLGSDLLDSSRHELRLEKSNILLLGPTGSGKRTEVWFHMGLYNFGCLFF